MNIKKEVADELVKVFGLPVHLVQVKQELEVPCFFVRVVNLETKSLASVDYQKRYTIIIEYWDENEDNFYNILNKLNKIKRIKDYNVNYLDVNMYDDFMRYAIEVVVPLKNLVRVNSDSDVYNFIIDEIESISNKKCYYQNGDIEKIEDGFFVLEPKSVTTQGISIATRKEKERELSIKYICIENEKDVPAFLEGVSDKLIKNIQGKRGIYKIDYILSIGYDKEEYDEMNAISYEINLLLNERS